MLPLIHVKDRFDSWLIRHIKGHFKLCRYPNIKSFMWTSSPQNVAAYIDFCLSPTPVTSSVTFTNQWLSNQIEKTTCKWMNEWMKTSERKVSTSWFLSFQSCAPLTSVWSSHHLGSLTSWWRGQTGPGELLFRPITQPLLRTEGQGRRARRRRERETEKRIYRGREGGTTKAPIWCSETGQGSKETR